MLRICFWMLLWTATMSGVAHAQFNPDTSSTQQPPRDSSTTPKNTKDQPFKERLFFGGSGGLSFGSNFTYIAAEPVIGVHVTERYDVAGGPKYIYFREDIPRLGTFQTSIYGGRTYSQYAIWRGLSGYLELEALNIDVPETESKSGRQWIFNTWVGPSYRQRFEGGGMFFIAYVYNLTDPIYSPFPNPRIIFGFGL